MWGRNYNILGKVINIADKRELLREVYNISAGDVMGDDDYLDYLELRFNTEDFGGAYNLSQLILDIGDELAEIIPMIRRRESQTEDYINFIIRLITGDYDFVTFNMLNEGTLFDLFRFGVVFDEEEQEDKLEAKISIALEEINPELKAISELLAKGIVSESETLLANLAETFINFIANTDLENSKLKKVAKSIIKDVENIKQIELVKPVNPAVQSINTEAKRLKDAIASGVGGIELFEDLDFPMKITIPRGLDNSTYDKLIEPIAYMWEVMKQNLPLNEEFIVIIDTMTDKGPVQVYRPFTKIVYELDSLLSNQSFYYVEGEDVQLEYGSDKQITIPPLFQITGITIERIKPSEFTKELGSKTDYTKKVYKDRGGAFFKFLLPEYCTVPFLNLMKRYQIFDNLTTTSSSVDGDNSIIKGSLVPELLDNCFVYACKISGVSESDLDNMRLKLNTRYITNKEIQILTSEIKAHCIIRYPKTSNGKLEKMERVENGIKFRYFGVKESEAVYKLNLVCYMNHYFVYEQVYITEYYVNNMKEINKSIDYSNNEELNLDVAFRFDGVADEVDEDLALEYGIPFKYKVAKHNRKISSIDLIRLLEPQLKPLTYGDRIILETDLYKYITKEIDIKEFNESNTCKVIKYMSKTKTKECQEYYYGDFEAMVFNEGKPTETHKAFCVSYVKRGESEIKNIWGWDCVEKLYEELPDKAIMYFHNLGYDCNFLGEQYIVDRIAKGTRTYTMKVSYLSTYTKTKKNFTFKDSLGLIAAPLSRFPAMFNLPKIEKEIFPYNFYDISTVNRPSKVKIFGAWNNEVKQWSEADIELFNSNIDKLNARVDREYFDARKYCVFYCNRDVEILAKGFEVFNSGCIGDFNMSADDYLTASSLANAWFVKNIYNNENIYSYSGIVREYIAGAVYGGRCMCSNNTSWHVNKELTDFDACSLYPSAMCRLWLCSGTPKRMTKDMLSLDYLMNHSVESERKGCDCYYNPLRQTDDKCECQKYITGYICDIQITKIGKHRDFPLIVKRENGLNINCNECVRMRVDNITLEDLVKYQEIECEVLNGIYWDGMKQFKVRDQVQYLYNKRVELKKAKNPLQEIYKLVMNSAYGKCIQKAIKKKTSYMSKADMEKYLRKNYYKVERIYTVGNKYAVETVNRIDNFFNNTLFGVQVLSMSKRIMSEVMTTAEDMGIKIYYQDTDSMHIEKSVIPLLSAEYKRIFNRELIGSGTGQFHSDFEPISKTFECPWGVESYFIGKKTYIDKLTDSTGAIGYHIRCKGIPKITIDTVIKETYDDCPIELFKDLFNDKIMEFDLCKNRVQFKFNKDLTINTLTSFKRRVQRNPDYPKVED